MFFRKKFKSLKKALTNRVLIWYNIDMKTRHQEFRWKCNKLKFEYHAQHMKLTLQSWLDHQFDDPLAIGTTYRTLYHTLHDLTGRAKEFWSGMASREVIDLLESKKIKQASHNHFFGGKNFALFLMGETHEKREVPDLEFIKTQIMKKGGCNWVSKRENQILKGTQDYSLITDLIEYGQPGEFYLENDEGDYVPTFMVETIGTLDGFYE